jgi:tripartite-type tricarboxylate transporter receptor subunit TctC
VKDFTPIALVAGVPFALIVNPQVPAKTLSEFIAYAKSTPGLAYGSAGNGSPQHLGAEMLKAAAAIDIRHVPYRGSVPAMLDVIAGHIPFMVVDLQPALQQIREGKVRVLGVTTPQRVAVASDIPTLAEAGLPGFELVAWQGVVAPAGVPRAIVDPLAAQIAKLMADPATRDSPRLHWSRWRGRRRTVLRPSSRPRSIGGPPSSKIRAPSRNDENHVLT